MAGFENESGLVCLEPKPHVLHYLVMTRDLELELIFPIRDKPSALFMELKADCLRKAGIIGELEKQWVASKIRALLENDHKQAA